MMNRLVLWFPMLFVGIGIFLSSFVVTQLPPIFHRIPDHLFGLIAHLCVYSCLGFFVCRYFSIARGWGPLAAVVMATGVCSALGLADEFHQSFVVGRSAQVSDFRVDFLAGALGSLVYVAFTRGGAAAEGSPPGELRSETTRWSPPPRLTGTSGGTCPRTAEDIVDPLPGYPNRRGGRSLVDTCSCIDSNIQPESLVVEAAGAWPSNSGRFSECAERSVGTPALGPGNNNRHTT